VEEVTPAIAERWINQNVSNRSLRPGLVEKYADDMRTGRWTQCAMPISFYDTGEIADGQHRLYAISESQTTQLFVVIRGLTKPDGLNIDTGANRGLVDNAKISGAHSALSHVLIAACRAIANGKRQPDLNSNSRKLDEVIEHQEAARWAIAAMGTRKGLVNAITLSAVARAWYHEADKDRLAEFCKALTSGFTNGTQDSGAVALRNYFLENGYGVMSTGPGWVDTFRRAQNAIYYFMRRRQLKVVKSITTEMYPLLKKKK
jgi:hypothetical protein